MNTVMAGTTLDGLVGAAALDLMRKAMIECPL
jgi:hypothetical protein